ncbi:MAG: histidine phosphatase family protein [Geminicoccaceae bacterium]
MRLILIRHGPTAWNRSGRLQGRHDLPLDGDGCRTVAGWRPDPAWPGLECRTSPLRRAMQTAELLGFNHRESEPLLIEMAWGRFEGCTIAGLRAELGDEMAANEARGLDFRPPGGESPREVVERFMILAQNLCDAPGDRVLVTHKGVRRAAIVAATQWNMLGKPPVRVLDDEALLLDLDEATGRLSLAGTAPMT